jgi:hypothetical protein
MATIFKNLDNENDVTSTRTLLHESIPITGSIISGTYTDKRGTEHNIKNYSHQMFQSVYDYPYLSSSANHIFDITMGYSQKSILSGTTNVVDQSKKFNIYNQMAQILVGHDATGSILEFDQDGNIAAGGTKFGDAIFLSFSRLLVKDEIKKGSFTLELGASGSYFEYDDGTFNERLKITDASGSNNYFTNSPAGDYGILYATASSPDGVYESHGHLISGDLKPCGLIYYQAGVVVLSSSIFLDEELGGLLHNDVGALSMSLGHESAVVRKTQANIHTVMTGTAISGTCDNLRNRIYNISFNNTTELNSTIYFCRANHNEFNYSSNPTYLSSSKIRVKEQAIDSPVAYITTVGLYSADNELLAAAKLSEPIKKTPETELTLRVRLDY